MRICQHVQSQTYVMKPSWHPSSGCKALSLIIEISNQWRHKSSYNSPWSDCTATFHHLPTINRKTKYFPSWCIQIHTYIHTCVHTQCVPAWKLMLVANANICHAEGKEEPRQEEETSIFGARILMVSQKGGLLWSPLFR